MGKKQQKPILAQRREFSLTPAVIVLNALIIVIIIMLCVFLYSYITASDNKPLVQANHSADNLPENTDGPAQTLVAAPETEPPLTTEAVPSMTKAALYPADFDNPDNPENPDFTPDYGEYDKAFFGSTLFIGDSIFTGLSNYDLLPAANLFAEIGLSPSTAFSARINGRGILEAVQNFDRVVIMLGTNGLPGADDAVIANIIESVKTLVTRIKQERPGIEVVILSVSPVASVNEYNVGMDLINQYNGLLLSAARECNCIFIDTGAVLKNADGYLADGYSQPDGMHLNKAAYERLLAIVQYELE